MACLLGAVWSTTGPAGAAGTDVGQAETALAEARDVRVRAEQRLGELQAERDRTVAELQRLETGAAQLTTDLAEAHREVREFAVAAYIDGGQSEVIASSLDPSESAGLAWRSHLVAGQAVTSSEAVERYTALREANDPDRVAAAAALDRIESDLEETFGAAIQAAAHERDAEHALAEAKESVARAEAQAKAEAEARAAAASAATRPSTGTTRRAAPAPQAGASAPAPAVSGATGSEAALLARIRHCESRGNYSVVSASGRYRGAYQFDSRTWASVGGTGDPAAASPAEQDARALQLLRQRGGNPWPNCS